MKMFKRATLVVFISVLCHGYVLASDEPLFEELKRRTKSDVFRIGALMQFVGTYEYDPADINNGFTLANFRLYLKGELDQGWGYALQTAFTRSPAFLDASLSYGRAKRARLRAGAFKAPFSNEFLTSAASIDFIDRSQVVRVLAPGRQIGIQLDGKTPTGFGYALGAFNGNGLTLTNDNNHVMPAARLFWSRPGGSDTAALDGAIHAYYSRDDDAPIGVALDGDFIATGFTGERFAGGVDVRMSNTTWLVAAEAIAARFEPRGGSTVDPYGYYATVGYMTAPDTQILMRWDSLRLDGAGSDADQIVLGANHWPTALTEIQLNAIVPVRGGRNFQLLANIQVFF